MSYQYLSEDDASFTIQHPDGNPFRIAKDGLSKTIIAKIAGMRPQNMAEGGEVGSPGMQVEPVDNTTYGPSPAQSYGPPEPAQAPAPQTPDSNPLSIEAMGSNKPMPMGPQNQPPVPQPTSENPNQGLSEQFQQIQKNQENAVNAGTQGQMAAQANIADAQKKQAEDAQTLTNVYTQKYADNDTEHTNLMKAYGEGKIDPNRVWNSMSTGGKALAGISLILGGIGSGLTGGPNLAQHALDRLQDRDIEAQKANLGKTANLLTMNMQKFHNLHQAELATRLEQNASLQAKIGQYVANSNSAQVQQNGGLLLAQLQTQGLEMKKNLAMAQAVASLSGGQGGSQGHINPQYLPEEAKKLLVNIKQPDGSITQSLALTPKDAEDHKKSQIETEAINSKINDAFNFMDTKGRSPGYGIANSEDSALANTIHKSIISSMGKLHDLNRLSDIDLELFKSMVPNPGQMNQASARVQLQYIQKLINDKVRASDATYLQNYNPGGIQRVAPNLKR